MSTFAHRVFSDMELDRKFEADMLCRSVSLGSLEPNQQYPIDHAERINSLYGQSVLLGILDSPTSSVKIFLPKRYGDDVSEVDLQVKFQTRGLISDL